MCFGHDGSTAHLRIVNPNTGVEKEEPRFEGGMLIFRRWRVRYADMIYRLLKGHLTISSLSQEHPKLKLLQVCLDIWAAG